MRSESGSTVIELVVSLTIIVAVASTLFLAFQSGNDGTSYGIRAMRSAYRALACDDAYRTAVRETGIAYWDRTESRVKELEARLRGIPRGGRVTNVRTIASPRGIPVGVEIRYVLDGKEHETVETFGSRGVMEIR